MNQKLFAKVIRYLSFRSRTEKEVIDILKKKHASDVEIKDIMDDLRKKKFINDAEFARQWVESRLRTKPKGWRLLKIELLQKGISKDIIEDQKSRMKHEADFTENEKIIIMKLIQTKIEKYRGMSRKELYGKLGGFLLRRGFSYTDIRKAIDEVLDNNV